LVTPKYCLSLREFVVIHCHKLYLGCQFLETSCVAVFIAEVTLSFMTIANKDITQKSSEYEK